ncbi:MAG: phosphotransferase [Streptomycetaceae bacterium]|nr:phosphotransferase [Streptomycetaceae bacterium]
MHTDERGADEPQELRAHEVAHVCAVYGFGFRGFRRLDGGTVNTNFLVETDRGEQYVLTVLSGRDRSATALAAGTMRWLAASGYPTSAPLDGDGRGPRGRTVALRPYIAGTVHDVLPVRLLGEAGAVLARLHELGLPPRELRLPSGGRRLPREAVAEIGAFADREFAAWLGDRLADPPLSDENLCMTHGDLFADNLVERADGTLAVLDWETASVDDPLLDLGMAVMGLGVDADGRLRAERLRALVDGYRRVRPLDGADMDRLRELARYAGAMVAYFRYRRRGQARSRAYTAMVAAVDDLPTVWPQAYEPVGTAG